jgi:hypothetical protein
MTENRPVAAPHGPGYFRDYGRAPVQPIGEKEKPVQQIKPPQIKHFAAGGMRPIASPLPATPIRVTREEIEAALHGPHVSYNSASEEIIDRILLEVERMDGAAPVAAARPLPSIDQEQGS